MTKEITIHVPGGKDRHSRNLRGILDYARVSPAASVRLYLVDGRDATYLIYFDDGAWCLGHFADWRVMRGWFAARRSWSAEIDDSLPQEGPPAPREGMRHARMNVPLCGDYRFA